MAFFYVSKASPFSQLIFFLVVQQYEGVVLVHSNTRCIAFFFIKWLEVSLIVKVVLLLYLYRHPLDDSVALADVQRQVVCEDVPSVKRGVELLWRCHLLHYGYHFLRVLLSNYMIVLIRSLIPSTWYLNCLLLKIGLSHHPVYVLKSLQHGKSWSLFVFVQEHTEIVLGV
jgi:hypothetical protein